MRGVFSGRYKLLVIGVFLIFLLQVQPVEAEQQVHRVQPGESLFSIAQKYGVKVEQLLASNKFLRFPDKLLSDLLLVIPEPEKETKEKIVKKTPLQPQATIPGANSESGSGSSGINSQKTDSSVSTGTKSLQAMLEELFKEYKNIVFLSGSSKSNKIALTFDDGPTEVTSNQVMDILRAYNVKGTFFLLGQNVAQYPQAVIRMVREGHVVGGHSWSHIQMEKASLKRIKSEVEDTENIIYKVAGVRPDLVRPPYGSLNRQGLEYLEQNGYKVVNWSVDSLDWKYPYNSSQVLISTYKDVRGGSIILFHTLPGKEPSWLIATVLPEIICTLQSQGYQFVTVDDLLGIPAYK